MLTSRTYTLNHANRYHGREGHELPFELCRDYDCKWVRSYLADRGDCTYGDLYILADGPCHEAPVETPEVETEPVCVHCSNGIRRTIFGDHEWDDDDGSNPYRRPCTTPKENR